MKPAPIANREVCAALASGPWVCAHGGDTSEAPPNTVAAYDLALRAAVECVEVDASRTADGHLVALHDRDLQAFSGDPRLRVGDVTLARLQGMDAGGRHLPQYHGQRVPTLEEALEVLKDKVKQVTIDVKVGPPAHERGLAADVVAAVVRTGCRSCLVWSKLDGVVEDLKARAPATRVGYVVMRDSATGQVGELLRMAAPEVVAVFQGLVTYPLVQEARRAGKEVHAWTVDDVPTMHRMIEHGVAAIVTSRPQVLQAAIARHRELCQKRGFLTLPREGPGGERSLRSVELAFAAA